MAKPSKSIVTIAITTGDPDGIGTEVACKALSTLKLPKGIRFALYRSPSCPKSHLSLLKRKFKLRSVTSFSEAGPWQSENLLDIADARPPVEWVIEAAKSCLGGSFQGLVTGPLSKTSIHDSGYSEVGHTEILSSLTKSQDLMMGFVGEKFSVVLLTGHTPLKDVSSLLSRKQVEAGIAHALRLRDLISGKKRRRPIALVGLNPHSGEAGLIGTEESRIFLPALEAMRRSGLPIEGPLVPDVAFQMKNQSRYSVYVCPYHDQGLIPFKLVHGYDQGVHVTLGLPFIRTSVDHGTAKDLFNRGVAKYGSMKDAISLALRMAQNKEAGATHVD